MNAKILIDKLADMDMHDSIEVDSETRVMRVPNGLLYITVVRVGATSLAGLPSRKAVTSTFVPLHAGSLKRYNT